MWSFLHSPPQRLSCVKEKGWTYIVFIVLNINKGLGTCPTSLICMRTSLCSHITGTSIALADSCSRLYDLLSLCEVASLFISDGQVIL